MPGKGKISAALLRFSKSFSYLRSSSVVGVVLFSACLPEVKSELINFDIDSTEAKCFRFCGRQFNQDENGATVVVVHNARGLRPIVLDLFSPMRRQAEVF
ncbi:unnamed protein product [Durusdinium trenchii]|uniref:Uncharacterized protein n=1 Tax=Durusdinium trenchii TaxID=1381693 RepID=A0ABP0HWJ5_9DINO